ncbi:hypothetical protein [Microbacterium aurum]
MNVLEALAGLLRRWYITVPGIILAAAAAFGVWSATSPEYVRSASQLLLPGDGVLPEGTTNQFLYIGGLGPVADVLARAVSGDESVREYTEAGDDVVVARDTSISGPVILLRVTAGSDAAAAEIIERLSQLTSQVLDDLQAEQGIGASDRVTVATISVDGTSSVSQRSRLIPTGAVAVIVVLLTLVIASIVDALLTKSRRRHLRGGTAAGSDGEPGVAADAGSDAETDLDADAVGRAENAVGARGRQSSRDGDREPGDGHEPGDEHESEGAPEETPHAAREAIPVSQRRTMTP